MTILINSWCEIMDFLSKQPCNKRQTGHCCEIKHDPLLVSLWLHSKGQTNTQHIHNPAENVAKCHVVYAAGVLS